MEQIIQKINMENGRIDSTQKGGSENDLLSLSIGKKQDEGKVMLRLSPTVIIMVNPSKVNPIFIEEKKRKLGIIKEPKKFVEDPHRKKINIQEVKSMIMAGQTMEEIALHTGFKERSIKNALREIR